MSKLSKIRPSTRSILVVDDEPDLLESLKELLEDCIPELTVRTAPGGAEGLEILAAHDDIDLVISDFRMPEMDGISFLRAVHDQFPRVARVLLTAYPDKKLAHQATEEAMVETFMTKPPRMEELLAAINAAVFKNRQTARAH